MSLGSWDLDEIVECLKLHDTRANREMKVIVLSNGGSIIKKVEERFPFCGIDAIIGGWNSVEVAIYGSQKEADMVDK